MGAGASAGIAAAAATASTDELKAVLADISPEAKNKFLKALSDEADAVASWGRSVFKQFDTDKSGKLDKKEITRALKALPKAKPKTIPPGAKFMSVDEMITAMDTDGDSKLDLNEWLDNLSKCAGLAAALAENVSADGKIANFRSFEEQKAKREKEVAALAAKEVRTEEEEADMKEFQRQIESLTKKIEEASANEASQLPAAASLTPELLQAQDDKTSGAVITLLQGDPVFSGLAKKELDGIVARDDEDARKLAAGVQQAIDKGVLPKDQEPPKYENVDVFGKTADQVADEIVAKLPKEGGCVMILVGLSGTGKGTTVDKIKSKVPNASTWSNGNCFRSLTLLAATYCEQQGKEFDPAILTSENLASWSSMLEFAKFDGKFDIRINGLGIDAKVSDIANTLLKEPKVGKNIPTVAKETQGEVVKFAGEACKKMGDDGTVVLVEGREQTLNFIPSPYRYCLTMSDTTVIGERRAAQRIAAHAAKSMKVGDDVAAVVKASLEEIAAQ